MPRCSTLTLLIALGLTASAAAEVPTRASATQPAPIGSRAAVGAVSGLNVEVTVQGPATEATELQVACVFEYVAGDIVDPPALPAPLNGMRHLDEALHGLISELRKSGQFEGRELETLLITPPAKTVKPDRVLLVGLGDRAKFTPDVMTRVGEVGMREALRLGVDHYAHASDLKDAGVDSPTRLIAQNVLRGALNAWRTQQYLEQSKMAPPRSLKTLTLLAGPNFFTETQAAARDLLTLP
jgi:Cytosol aminopeptidase family, N-terminal domain